jgi:hypothetical protein
MHIHYSFILLFHYFLLCIINSTLFSTCLQNLLHVYVRPFVFFSKTFLIKQFGYRHNVTKAVQCLRSPIGNQAKCGCWYIQLATSLDRAIWNHLHHECSNNLDSSSCICHYPLDHKRTMKSQIRIPNQCPHNQGVGKSNPAPPHRCKTKYHLESMFPKLPYQWHLECSQHR